MFYVKWVLMYSNLIYWTILVARSLEPDLKPHIPDVFLFCYDVH